MIVTCYLKGGLGNQLFQIFTVIGYSLNHKCNIVLQDCFKSNYRNTYWDSLLSNLKDFTKEYTSINLSSFVKYTEPAFHYNEIPFINNNIVLDGYFQSYKYFDNHFFDIIKIINLDYLIEKTKTKYSHYFENNNTISMHFRLGDYKQLQDCHPILPYEYYEKSLEKIINHTNKDNYNILYFYEKDDADDVCKIIDKLKKQFIYLHFINIDTNIVDWEQMLLMSICNHNIIANSTFSWWSAYIGYKKNENKIVCYPSRWFGSSLENHNTNDLFMEKWINI
jgi:hypothetical protein